MVQYTRYMAVELPTHSQDFIKIDVDPSSRRRYIEDLLRRDGLTGISEDPRAAYCAISLTSTPDELKPILKERQFILTQILEEAGISAYDPSSAPFSPDRGLEIGPDEIYRVDKGKLVGARFFVTHDILPSTGVGVEIEAARMYNRISVVLHDAGIRTSRMQANRTIHLWYNGFAAQAEEFVRVFQFLQGFEPGIGFDNGVPVLLGFDTQGRTVNLEQAVYSRFPQLQYHYNGQIPIVQTRVINPQIICEKVN